MFSPEESLVRMASRVNPDAQAVAELRKQLGRSVDWPAVLKLAIPHGTLPLIARNLRCFAADQVPENLLRQTGVYAERIQLRYEQAKQELVEILRALRRWNIGAVPFKGPILDATLYRGAGVREFADMDLMVRRDELSRGVQALESRGYRLKARQQGRLGILSRKGDGLEFEREGRISVDLHWRFAPRGFDFRLDPESLRTDLQKLRIEEFDVPVYDPQGTLLILCGHQAKHRWRRLNWLCDMEAFLDTYYGQMDWSTTLQRARDTGCERIVLITLELTAILLGVLLPDMILARMEQEREARRLAQRLAPALLTSPSNARLLYLQMREGNPILVAGRYVASKVRQRLA
jgi:hypothetical protein